MSQSRPLGPKLVDWRPPPAPGGTPLVGRYARLDRLDADRHAGDLHRAMSGDASLWDYMPYGPFSSASQYHRWAREAAAGTDPLFYAITDLDAGQVCGVASYLRIKPNAGSIEAGHINLAPALQRTRAATEAFYLMMDWAFGAGYRRFEWKCDALNMPSRRAAQRLGLSYEGTFRQATVVKGRNRDTAWFATIDTEWPALKEAFGFWLGPANFDAEGRQRERLGALTRLVRVTSDPVQNGG
ncbi:Protein N-acetyltransferase, RimJ/RimL family [Roseovarius tolerans]|uniref:Protein N-acetyltransferase, RimJ/RimL family n=1 Tax=Roseovarius tolerans TaxID=74031 RepID=A0A1H7ZME4_9RHOB|nr:GNAT family protein [Roseovarius tolerans]SEM59453.1 Protein N-acetyltransferase, RimJ/RimL family [Roseovarius tolerans]